MTNTITNADRAEWAASALRDFQGVTGTDLQDVLCDLLCDLMHWTDISKFDFDKELHRASSHYHAEVAKERQAKEALQKAASDMLEALELCEDALTDLARHDDGTPSISALNAARKAIVKAKGGAA